MVKVSAILAVAKINGRTTESENPKVMTKSARAAVIAII
ncbi:unannotated protein [freshwater metagenome]|uniref:Unannotated protein n=1 Tax=freshwater metagenome TaxID=449393 RepID=A0A6J5ZGL7_9ZZZZ